jgi:tRNA (pseudouridine54-N1)-methyltransferase
MREFILRARKGPTTPEFPLAAENRPGFLEVVSHCVVNTLFTAGKIRPDTVMQIVLDGPSAPPKTVRLESDNLCSLGGYDEVSILGVIQRALREGRSLALEAEIQVDDGLFVAKRSFEKLVRDRAASGTLYYLQPSGTDVRDEPFNLPASFVFTDHLSMPKKSDKFLERLGARPLSVGPKSLFASQCVVLVHNELDRRGFD